MRINRWTNLNPKYKLQPMRRGQPKDRDVQLVSQMIDLMRELGGPIEQINSSKYLHNVINIVLDRLMIEGSAKPARTTAVSDPKTNNATQHANKK